jgi:hypothetical protein
MITLGGAAVGPRWGERDTGRRSTASGNVCCLASGVDPARSRLLHRTRPRSRDTPSSGRGSFGWPRRSLDNRDARARSDHCSQFVRARPHLPPRDRTPGPDPPAVHRAFTRTDRVRGNSDAALPRTSGERTNWSPSLGDTTSTDSSPLPPPPPVRQTRGSVTSPPTSKRTHAESSGPTRRPVN